MDKTRNQNNSFGLFLKENITTIQQKAKNSPKMFFKIASNLWKNLKPQEKKKYKDKIDRLQSEFKSSKQNAQKDLEKVLMQENKIKLKTLNCYTLYMKE
jgi:hypothetical protein